MIALSASSLLHICIKTIPIKTMPIITMNCILCIVHSALFTFLNIQVQFLLPLFITVCMPKYTCGLQCILCCILFIYCVQGAYIDDIYISCILCISFILYLYSSHHHFPSLPTAAATLLHISSSSHFLTLNRSFIPPLFVATIRLQYHHHHWRYHHYGQYQYQEYHHPKLVECIIKNVNQIKVPAQVLYINIHNTLFLLIITRGCLCYVEHKDILITF